MVSATKTKSFSLASIMFLSIFLTGCIGLDSSVDPRASLLAYPLSIQEGETVTLDATDSEAVDGVITDFEWDFGDGQKAETVIGFTFQALSPSAWKMRGRSRGPTQYWNFSWKYWISWAGP